MLERDIFAGFGGQGVLFMGQLLAQAALLEGINVAWLPSYGPEMRGGTANCSVTVSDQPIASPIIDKPTSLIAMNRPSLDKFEERLIPGGKLFINSSIVDRQAKREDVAVYYIPCSELALELDNARVANIVMLGAYIQATGCVRAESVLAALTQKLGAKHPDALAVNQLALLRGAALVE